MALVDQTIHEADGPAGDAEVCVSALDIEYERDDQVTRAISNLNLVIRPGEFVSVVGPSGCGKSTLLLAIDGLLEPSAGYVSINGTRVTGPGRDRSVVFQEASLLPWRTVLQNVRYGLDMSRTLSRSERDDLAREHIDMVGLSGFEQFYPHQLSGGMQQRVNIARALVTRPKVLLLDEPFAALDSQTRETMQSELVDLWQQFGITTVFITHQIDEAVYLSDRVVALSQRPASILLDIDIPFERPRSLEVKRTDEFRDIEAQLWRLMRREVTGVE